MSKCPMCQPDLPVQDIQVCEECRVKFFLTDSIARVLSRLINSAIFDNRQEKKEPQDYESQLLPEEKEYYQIIFKRLINDVKFQEGISELIHKKKE